MAPTSLYRYYDRHDFLIYVGITKRNVTRQAEHNMRAEWWPFVVRQEVDHFTCRADAEAAESALIRAYRPPFNTQHNPDHTEMRAVYLAWTAVDIDAIDPHMLANQLRRTLPLEVMEASATDVLLRTRPEHYPVSRLLGFPEVGKVLISGGRGKVRSIESRGPFLVLSVHGKNLPPAAGALAHFRFRTQKPVAFRLSSLQLLHRKAV